MDIAIGYLLFAVRSSLFAICYLLFAVCCLLFAVCYLLFAAAVAILRSMECERAGAVGQIKSQQGQKCERGQQNQAFGNSCPSKICPMCRKDVQK